MNNILVIIQREYLTRVRKKSFIIMTIVGPLLMALMYGGIIWAAVSSINQKKIGIVDESKQFEGKIKGNKEFTFSYLKENIDAAKLELKKGSFDAVVEIPPSVFENGEGVKIFSQKAVSLELQSNVENTIQNEIERVKLAEAGITQSVLDEAKVKIKSETINLENNQEKVSSAGASSAIGGICGFLIYMAVFIYGAQVMRSITEEKTSRIVEVLISSVKPFQLLIGKIVGVGLVGLTQFLLWIVLSIGVVTLGTKIVGEKVLKAQQAKMTSTQLSNLSPESQKILKEKMESEAMNNVMPEIFGALNTLPVTTIVVSFLFYFLGGYLFYSALFGAVGSAVDSDSDTQQFMLPITIPIIASIVMLQFIIRDPTSNLAFWMSMIPFFSPIIMMARIPFGVPIWQIVLSISLLIMGFVFTTWLASRIYRVGILMYGKKPTWKEIGKWIFYSN